MLQLKDLIVFKNQKKLFCFGFTWSRILVVSEFGKTHETMAFIDIFFKVIKNNKI